MLALYKLLYHFKTICVSCFVLSLLGEKHMLILWIIFCILILATSATPTPPNRRNRNKNRKHRYCCKDLVTTQTANPINKKQTKFIVIIWFLYSCQWNPVAANKQLITTSAGKLKVKGQFFTHFSKIMHKKGYYVIPTIIFFGIILATHVLTLPTTPVNTALVYCSSFKQCLLGVCQVWPL